MTNGSPVGTAPPIIATRLRTAVWPWVPQRRGDRGQLGLDDLRQQDVVHADHADVIRHCETQPVQALDDPDGQHVVVGDDRGRRLGHDLAHPGEAGVDRRSGCRAHPPYAHLELVGGLAQRLPADPVGPAGLGAGEVGHRGVAELAEVLHRPAHPPGVVDEQARHLGQAPVEHDDGPLLGQGADRAVRHPRAGEHHPVDGRELALDPLPLDVRVLLGVRQPHAVAELGRRLVGPPDDLARRTGW